MEELEGVPMLQGFYMADKSEYLMQIENSLKEIMEQTINVHFVKSQDPGGTAWEL